MSVCEATDTIILEVLEPGELGILSGLMVLD
jgi:hypothetical protein